MGVSEEDIKAMLDQQASNAAAQSGQDFEIYDDNWDSWLFYLAVQTQWVYVSGMCVQRIGLNYMGVESAARMSAKPRSTWPALLADLQVIELAVLEADAEMAEKEE